MPEVVTSDGFENLGRALLVLRVVRGLSQKELARQAGIRPNQISRYETGQVLPQLTQLDRLLKALRIGVVDFFLFFAQVNQLVAALDLPSTAGVEQAPEVQGMLRELVARQVRVQERVLAGVEALMTESAAISADR